jgi:hypothetical protein
MKIIIRYRDTGTSTKMTLTEFPCSIGRAPTSHIVLPLESVSGNHAVIEKREGVFLIRDLESKNGIVCDGERLPSVMLNPHTIVSVGTVDIEVIEMTASLNDQTKSMMAPARTGSPSIGLSFGILALVPLVALLKTYFLGSAAVYLGLAAAVFLIVSTIVFSAFSAWVSSFFDQSYKLKKAFSKILCINALFFGISAVVDFFTPFAAFNLDNTEVWTLVRTGISALSVGIFLYFYCKTVFLGDHRRGLGIIGTSLTSLVGILVVVGIYTLPERSYLAGAITKPFRSFTRENRSLADFDAKMKQSFDRIEKERIIVSDKARTTEAESGK